MPPAAPALRARLVHWTKSHLPHELVDLLRELRGRPRGDRRRFASLRLRRAIRSRPDLSTLPHHPTVMFICHGNRLRSPMAEALMQRAAVALGLQGVHVISAGTHARPGTGASPDALVAASRHGVSLAEHQARVLTETLMRGADLVFVMDRRNEADVITRYADVERRVLLLGAFARDRRDGAVIPDPDNGTMDDLQRCYARVDACITSVARELARARAPVR